MTLSANCRACLFVGIAMSLLPVALVGTAKSAERTGYHIELVAPLNDGGTGWDHLSIDSANRHVFVGRGQAGLAVLDADTGAFLRMVPETQGSHGAAIASDLGLGFSDNAKGGDLTIFDLKTLEPTAHLKAGETTDGVFYDPFTKTGFVNNGETGQMTFFDPVTRTVLGSVDLATKKPEFATVDGRGNAHIDLQDRNAVARIDIKARTVAETWTVAGCELPSGLEYDAASNRLFVGCRGSAPVLAVLDVATGRTVATVAIGEGNDWVGFDAKNKLILATNGTVGTLTVIAQLDADHYKEVETVGTRTLSRTGAFDPVTGTVVIVAARYSRPGPDDTGKPGRNRIEPGTSETLLLRPKNFAE